MATTYGNVSVGSTATLILAANSARIGCLIGNNSTAAVYVGPDANITTTTGIPVAAGATLVNSDFYAAFKGSIYGIVATGSADVRYWEWGQ